MLLSPRPSNAQPSSYEPMSHSPTQSLLTSLQSPIASLEDLEDLLLQSLTGLGVVPPPSRKVSTELGKNDILHVLPTIQHVLLSTVLPTWFTSLQSEDLLPLVKQYFCPSRGSDTRKPQALETCCRIATSGLSTLLSHLRALNSKDPGPTAILEFSLSTIVEISTLYPLDMVHSSLFTSVLDSGVHSELTEARRMREWEDYVRNACSVPGKVANAAQGRTDLRSREGLEHGPFFSKVCVHTENLIFEISRNVSRDTLLPSQTHLLLKLLNLGLFPPSPPSLPSQPAFFASTLPHIRRRLGPASIFPAAAATYAATWAEAVRSLPSTSQQTFVASLFGSLDCHVGMDTSAKARRNVGEGSKVLRGILGKLGQTKEGSEELWGAVTSTTCASGRTWDLGIARAIVYWMAEPRDGNVDEGALEKFLDAIIAVWADPEYIRHSLLSQHRYTSSLVLLTLASLPRSSSAPSRLALSPPFVSSISTYLGHLDRSVRRCGMLVAEAVAARCGKQLEFGGWDDATEFLDWARTVRGWTSDWTLGEDEPPAAAPPVPSPSPPASPPPQPESYDSDDSLTGYASASSSRTPSPTPSELAEIEQDPSLRVGRTKRPARPVYLAQLAEMLRTGGNDDAGEAERLEIALEAAEGLVRRKKGFGLELEENAVELTIALVGLHDNYDTVGFDEKRQGALNALVACCPRRAAMTLTEQFFTNQYATVQRVAMLTALALGARELAGLPAPAPAPAPAFPSKLLPPALHRKYGGAVQQVLQGITRHAIDTSKAETAETLPPVVRERKLRLGTSRVVVQHPAPAPKVETTFADVAAEHFIVPLVNHMWQHLQDTQGRAGGRAGAGTGMILGAVVLAQYLGTLAVLAHAARHAPAYVGVVAPAALELGVALGSRPFEAGEWEGEDAEKEKEAAVLTAALELALVVLDACAELDGGRELALHRTALLLAVGEWAGGVFGALERGRRVRGAGGEAEGRLGSAAAGVVLKVEWVTDKWRRSMIGV